MHTAIIIDDSKTSRSVLRTILEKNGYEIVAEAANGEEGFEKYCDLHPDFVTLDITMPVMDGIQTLVKIKEYDPGAKVIMVTAAGQKGKMVDAIKLVLQNLLQNLLKQIRLSVLLKVLKNSQING